MSVISLIPRPKLRIQNAYFQCPDWAGIPSKGIHFEVQRRGQAIDTLDLDDLPYYLFGRQSSVVDYPIEHQSLSRVHLALVHHRNGSCFIIDLGSANGTYLNKNKLEPKKLVKIQEGDQLNVGELPLTYVFRSSSATTQQETSKPTIITRSSGSGLYDGLPEDNQNRNSATTATAIPTDEDTDVDDVLEQMEIQRQELLIQERLEQLESMATETQPPPSIPQTPKEDPIIDTTATPSLETHNTDNKTPREQTQEVENESKPAKKRRWDSGPAIPKPPATSSPPLIQENNTVPENIKVSQKSVDLEKLEAERREREQKEAEELAAQLAEQQERKEKRERRERERKERERLEKEKKEQESLKEQAQPTQTNKEASETPKSPVSGSIHSDPFGLMGDEKPNGQ